MSSPSPRARSPGLRAASTPIAARSTIANGSRSPRVNDYASTVPPTATAPPRGLLLSGPARQRRADRRSQRDDLDRLVHRVPERSVVVAREQHPRIPSAPAEMAPSRGHGDRERVLLPDVAHVERDLARRDRGPLGARTRAAANSLREQFVALGDRGVVESRMIRVRAAVCVRSAPSRPHAEKLPAYGGTTISRISSSRASSVPKSGPAPPNGISVARRGSCPARS